MFIPMEMLNISRKIGDLVAFERENGISFSTETSLSGTDGCIIMQTSLMKEVLNESSNPSQTDSVEGFVTDLSHPSVNVCVTSTYCPIRLRYYPTQFGILYGKTQLHYKFYFRALLKSMEFRDFDHLGMTI